MIQNSVRTRFAPSPTGLLHLGHAYSAIYSYNYAMERGGEFILRIEDIDPLRCKAEYIDQIFEDLEWLGLRWAHPVRIQSRHYTDYEHYLNILLKKQLLYPCICSRKDIKEEIERSGYAPHGPEGPLYPQICKDADVNIDSRPYALRLDLEKALDVINPEHLFWEDNNGQIIYAKPEILGDIVLSRKDINTTYHLSVVVDDALQEITHITRGKDLQFATHIQCVLQEIFGFRKPIYSHHQIITDDKGNRFAKRDHSKTLKEYREQGKKPEDVYNLIGLRPLN